VELGRENKGKTPDRLNGGYRVRRGRN
jgi:hypothetical protein